MFLNLLYCRTRLSSKIHQRYYHGVKRFQARKTVAGISTGFSLHMMNAMDTHIALLIFILELGMSETTDDMIVYHADSLHEGITNCRADKLEPFFLQVFAHGFRLRSACGNIRHLFP
jgi:hypothetical protein